MGGEGPKKRIDAKGWSSGDAPMAAGDGGLIPVGEDSSEAWEGAGEVEDKGRKVLVEGIDERGPEEGDQRKGATAERAERALLVSGRREEEKGGNDSRVPQEGKISGCYTCHASGVTKARNMKTYLLACGFCHLRVDNVCEWGPWGRVIG